MDNNNVALITKMVLEAVEKQKSSEKEPGYLVPVGVSARHIHLTQEHVEALFGPGYQLTKKKELMGGQFASNETVTIVGLKLRAIENVRILGPVRMKDVSLQNDIFICRRKTQWQPECMTGMWYPCRRRMKEALFSIMYRSVWMTALRWRCISILMKRMQRRLRLDRL